MVVGTLKPSITFGLLPSLHLARACSSSLQLTPAHSQLAPSLLPGASHLVKLSLPDILNSYLTMHRTGHGILHGVNMNCICQNVQKFSYWNRYFVIYPHKCASCNLKKKYQEKWENVYLRVENARASRTLRRTLDPDQYWLALLAQLHFATSARSLKISGPPLTKSWIR